MEPEAAQELMEIQSALQGELAIKTVLSYEPGKRGDRCITFKRPLSCSKCGKAFTTKSKFDGHERIYTSEKLLCYSKCDKKLRELEGA